MRGTALLIAVGSLALAGSPALADVCLTVEGVTQNLTSGTQGTCSTSEEFGVKLNDVKDVSSGTGTVGSDTVDFSTTGSFTLSNGNANIRPGKAGKDAFYPDLTIDASGFTFTDILFGLQMQNLGTDSLTVKAWDGATLEGQWDLTGISHDKDDKFAIIASMGQLFTEITLTAAGDSGIFETKQIAFSGIPGVVPKSSTWAMMLVGLAALGFAGYRKTKGARTAVFI